MTSRSLSVFALGLSLSVTSAFPAAAQSMAPADASSSNAAPAAPAAPAPATPTTPEPAAPATPAPADTTATPEERPTTYTMAAGDSLDSIAHKFNTSIRALAKLNKIPKSKYRKLRAGTVLQIPPAKPEAASASTNK